MKKQENQLQVSYINIFQVILILKTSDIYFQQKQTELKEKVILY